MNHRTICQAIEDASRAETSRGYRFFPETGVPGYGPPGSDGAEAAEASFSYTAVERMTARFGGALQALGLRKGDRVALILPANDDFVLCFLGAIRAGIIPVPIYPPMALGALQAYLDNTRHIVAKSGARGLVTTSKIKRLLGTVQAACPALEQVVAIEGIRESTEPLKAEKITLEDPAFLQFTSGSTSRPKGVTLTHGNLAANIQCIMVDGLRMVPDDIAVSWLPLYHDMGLIGFVLAPIFHTVPVVFLPPLLFLKRPITWFQAFTKVSGSTAYAPNFAYALCVKRIKAVDLEGLDVSRWRVAGCGAEPIRPETLEAFADTFAKIGFKKEALLPSYGMAESSLAISFTELHEGMKTLSLHGPDLWEKGVVRTVPEGDEDAVRLVSCGKEFPLHQVRIFAPDDATSATPLAEDTVGELRISGPSVMRGYWEDAERTKETFAGPFLRTGDLGFLHEGHVFICGRSKEVVIVNGRNYYPQDMEWEAGKVAGVRRGNVVAFGARDPSGVERDRERVVLAFEVQDAERLGHSSGLIAEVRKAVQEGMGLTLDDVV
ncbi:MAG TPA: fatty acyl-AMP ligase, partial [Polyangiaceae bacterium]